MSTVLTYEARAKSSSSPVVKRLLEIIISKKSNLAVSIDVTDPDELVAIIEKVGEFVCLVKTHIDILTSFPPSLPQILLTLSQKHNFLILEDRKFADIGHTVSLQYASGIYRIVDWADLVTVHAIPGDGILDGLKLGAAGGRLERGCVLLAEMSSQGHLLTPEYRKQAVEMAQRHRDFVLGFIAMRPPGETGNFLTLTPGVQIIEGNDRGDGLGQQYRTPRDVVREGSDVIIVGRGIYGKEDVRLWAQKYKDEGWQGYLERIGLRK